MKFFFSGYRIFTPTKRDVISAATAGNVINRNILKARNAFKTFLRVICPFQRPLLLPWLWQQQEFWLRLQQFY
jgi:hypothetical protein